MTAAAATISTKDVIGRTLAPEWYEKINGVSHDELTTETFNTLRHIMERRRLKLSEAHWAALFSLCLVFTETAQGVQKERLVIGAPTGGGKTSLVIAFLAALDKLGLDDVGVVVCQNRIAALQEMRQELRALSVSARRITLLHSDRQSSTEPSDNHGPSEARQFVLMTHAAVSDRGRLHAFREWKGQPRLVCWDEALWTQTPQSIQVPDVVMQRANLKFLTGLSPDNEALHEVNDYTGRLENTAVAAVACCREAGVPSKAVSLEACDDYEKLNRMRTALTSQKRATFPALDDLLSVAQLDEVLVRAEEGGGGVISFTEAIPADLGGILVLDASWAVRDLLHADKTLKSAEDVPEVKAALEPYGLKTLSDLKTYEQVKVKQILASGGRRSIVGTKREKGKVGDLQKPKPVILPIVVDTIVNAWDEGAGGALVYLFKEKADDPSAVDVLKAALEAERPGLTVHRVKPTASQETTWLHTAHHGSETGFNRARHCELVVIWGTLFEKPVVMDAKILAAHNDLNADISRSKRRHYEHTEKLDRLLQAISRGSLRNPGANAGEASPMRAVVIDCDHHLGLDMVKEFRGIEWEFELGPRKHSRQQRGLGFLAGRALRRFLAEQEGDKVSSGVAKRAVEAVLGEKLGHGTWQRLRDLTLPSIGWKAVARTLHRC